MQLFSAKTQRRKNKMSGKIRARFECKNCGKSYSFKISENIDTLKHNIDKIKNAKGCPNCKKKGDNFVNISNDPIVE